jgi:hypothetical protein
LIVRHKVVHLAGQRLSDDPGIGRIVHSRGGACLLVSGGRRSYLYLRLMEQGSQQWEQIRRFALEHFIGFS